MCFDSRHWTPFDSICTTSPPSLQDTFKIPNTPAIPSDRFFHPLSSFSHIQCSIQQFVCYSMSLFCIWLGSENQGSGGLHIEDMP